MVRDGCPREHRDNRICSNERDACGGLDDLCLRRRLETILRRKWQKSVLNECDYVVHMQRLAEQLFLSDIFVH